MISLCVLLLFIPKVSAQFALNSIPESSTSPVFADYEYIEDQAFEYSVKDVQQLNDSQWQKSTGQGKTFGFSDSQYWLRMSLTNPYTEQKYYLLEVDYPLLDNVVFYVVRGDGDIRAVETGDTKNFLPRDTDTPNPTVRFELKTNESVSVFVKVSTEGSMILPLKFWHEKDYFEYVLKEDKAHFFYYGAIAVIVLINLGVFVKLRERLYLFYATAIFAYLLFFSTSRGHLHQLIIPNLPEVNTQIFVSSMPILALFSLLFAREFLRTWKHSPKTDLCLRLMIYFEVANLFVSIFFNYNLAVKLSAVSSFVLFAILFAAGPITWMAGRRAGIYFTVAWLPLTIGVAATGGRSAGMLPNNFWTEYAMQLGSGIEAIILTLALADRLYREREKKISAQAESLAIEKQRAEAQHALSEAMSRDAVTQLLNRNRFELLIEQQLKEHESKGFVICIVRITRQQEITRTLGLSSSEAMSNAFALKLNENASALPGVVSVLSSNNNREAVFQMSGDTFGLLIEQAVSQQHLNLYRECLQSFSEPLKISSLVIVADPHFGCAMYPRDGKTPTALIRNAYVAMESSLQNDDRIGWYNHNLDIYDKSRLTLMSDLKEALANNETTLHYQPKVNLKTNEVVGIEALIRWHRPEQGDVYPSDFIPLAEETGVISELTKWALFQAVKDIKQLDEKGFKKCVSINISAKDLLNKNIINYCESAISLLDEDPSRLCLELTETAAMEDPEAGLAVLKLLNELGVKLSIDDFGTGYSSLSYLKQLPVSELKLDRSLVQDIAHDQKSKHIAKIALEMAHSLGFEVVAEGVEDKDTYQALQELNCDYAQGYFLARPMPLESLKEWL